jgi:hypothetical protein
VIDQLDVSAALVANFRRFRERRQELQKLATEQQQSRKHGIMEVPEDWKLEEILRLMSDHDDNTFQNLMEAAVHRSDGVPLTFVLD